MAKKEFHYQKGEHEVDVSIEYRMPTKQEFLGIAGIISIVSGVCLLVKAFVLKDD
ncbi:hypothetical protein [Alkalibacterium olivapovliticus]|uniref:Uncharacterized protein n=1 Tax=Alkalibacterium olivapovliticus TaxID=99907 RepID=A0A2T0W7Q8_9LACT|nr:hypothetical protein [Alkalibacterium olivapovliticus]PRY82722.1 hypothetical protein CLV38_10951 [Alkalibacterium olivapovliticus]